MASSERVTRALALAIRQRRESLAGGATQEDIAHKARISVRHLQKLEHGLGNPKLDTLLAVAAALKTTLQALLDQADKLITKREL